MPGKSATRVLQGLGQVVEVLVSKQQPIIAQKLARMQYHMTELIHLMAELKDDWSQQSPPKEASNNSKDKVVVVDPIGFSSIPDSEENRIKDKANINTKNMKESTVPASQMARLWNFGTLATRLAVNMAAERVTSSNSSSGMSDANADILSNALCRMRGAALKLGQMLSLQDETTLPPSLQRALQRVKEAADYMPQAQLEAQLESQLGSNWRSKFKDFDMKPIAAASIGQVHKGTLLDGTAVAIKLQYPGVADSIDSDLNNLKHVVTMTNILPPGLFIDQIIKVAKSELALECDYELEGRSQSKYREFILKDPVLSKYTYVPAVYSENSTKRVLVSELISGVSIDKAVNLSQPIRNAIARTVLYMTVKELFSWRFIQSDPNYGNFLYDDEKRVINLIDFGAAREYSKPFVDGYMQLVWAAANNDRETISNVSRKLNFLTGDETVEMLDAHIETGLVVGEPFRSNEPYDFANAKLTERISKYGDVFMKYRLTPPPTEAYSLHRKLAGAFSLAIKLKANIVCRDILENEFKSYVFDAENAEKEEK